MGTSASLIRCDSAGEATQPEDDATEFHRQEEFILSTVYPDLTSYTWEDPRPGELLQLQNLSIDVNTYPYMLAFDRAFFSILGQFERPVPFFARGYSFQKAFLVKLLVVVLHPVSEYSEIYEAFVELFITQYLAEGVAISECKYKHTCDAVINIDLTACFATKQMARLAKRLL